MDMIDNPPIKLNNQGILEHFYFNSRYQSYRGKDGEWKIGDLMNSQEKKKIVEYTKNEIKSFNNVASLAHHIQIEYFPEFFRNTKDYYSDEEYIECLIHVWKLCEWGFSSCDENEMLEWFIKGKKYHNSNTMINREKFNQRIINDMDKNNIDVYTSAKNSCMMWTLDKYRCEEHSLRQGRVKVKDILAYIEENDEIIINPVNVEIVEDKFQ